MKTYSYGKQNISEDDIKSVIEVLKSPYLTCGPKVKEFEKAICDYTGAKYCVALNSATSTLHVAMMALGIGKGDEVITTPITFLASANCARYCGADVKFADIESDTANIDPDEIEKHITDKTKAIIPVHFAGQSCDMEKIYKIAQKHDLKIVEDAAHAIGSEYKGKKIGFGRGARHIAVFSFHPTKNITTGEGGMICTNDEEAAELMSMQRQNGMSKGAWNRYQANGKAHYDIFRPGLKYQMMDIQAAIGRDQLTHLEEFNNRRREIVARYQRELKDVRGLILPPEIEEGNVHSWHIYTPLIDIDELGFSRDDFMAKMSAKNIGTAYHYQALHLFTCFGELTGLKAGDLPNSEYVSERIVSLPLFPAMTDEDVTDVIEAIKEICGMKG